MNGGYYDDEIVFRQAGGHESSAEEADIEYDEEVEGQNSYDGSEATVSDETDFWEGSYEHEEGTESEEGESFENTNEGPCACEKTNEDDRATCACQGWNRPAIKLPYVYEDENEFTPSPVDIEYAFLRHMVDVFEASFHDFVHRHFGNDIKSRSGGAIFWTMGISAS